MFVILLVGGIVMNKYKMRLVLYSISFLFLVGLMTLSCFATWQIT